jgi:tetratricopeptide (TPR) repeat protein
LPEPQDVENEESGPEEIENDILSDDEESEYEDMNDFEELDEAEMNEIPTTASTPDVTWGAPREDKNKNPVPAESEEEISHIVEEQQETLTPEPASIPTVPEIESMPPVTETVTGTVTESKTKKPSSPSSVVAATSSGAPPGTAAVKASRTSTTGGTKKVVPKKKSSAVVPHVPNLAKTLSKKSKQPKKRITTLASTSASASASRASAASAQEQANHHHPSNPLAQDSKARAAPVTARDRVREVAVRKVVRRPQSAQPQRRPQPLPQQPATAQQHSQHLRPRPQRPSDLQPHRARPLSAQTRQVAALKEKIERLQKKLHSQGSSDGMDDRVVYRRAGEGGVGEGGGGEKQSLSSRRVKGRGMRPASAPLHGQRHPTTATASAGSAGSCSNPHHHHHPHHHHPHHHASPGSASGNFPSASGPLTVNVRARPASAAAVGPPPLPGTHSARSGRRHPAQSQPQHLHLQSAVPSHRPPTAGKRRPRSAKSSSGARSSRNSNSNLLDPAERIERLMEQAEGAAEMGNFEVLVQCRSEIVATCNLVSGPQSTPMVKALLNLADAYLQRGYLDQALERVRRAYTLNNELGLKENRLLMPSILLVMGIAQTMLKKYKEAEKTFRHALLANENVNGTDHFSSCPIYMSFSNMRSKQKRFKQAYELMRKAWELKEAKVGVLHPETAEIYVELAKLQEKMGNETVCVELLLRAHKAFVESQHDSCKKNFDVCILLVSKYSGQDQHSEAEPFLKKAIDVSIELYGASSSHVLNLRREYIVLMLYLNRIDEASTLCQEALSMETIRNPDSLRLAETLQLMSTIHVVKKQWEEALGNLRNCHRIFVARLGDGAGRVSKVEADIRKVSKKMEAAESAAWQEKQVQIRTGTPATGSPPEAPAHATGQREKQRPSALKLKGIEGGQSTGSGLSKLDRPPLSPTFADTPPGKKHSAAEASANAVSAGAATTTTTATAAVDEDEEVPTHYHHVMEDSYDLSSEDDMPAALREPEHASSEEEHPGMRSPYQGSLSSESFHPIESDSGESSIVSSPEASEHALSQDSFDDGYDDDE